MIYVQNVPTGDPNSSCATHPLGYPKFANDITKYDCRSGDVFLQGTLKGRLTIASANSIVVIEDVKYLNPNDTDLLGLVADNYVEIYHPVRCTNWNNGVCTGGAELMGSSLDNVTVQAAMLSVKHSFRVQNYFMGSAKQKLNVLGAIAQSYRGAVGTFSGGVIKTGYAKGYVYDQRLKYQSPPHFLDPVQSAWQVKTWSEFEPCYSEKVGAVRPEAPCV